VRYSAPVAYHVSKLQLLPEKQMESQIALASWPRVHDGAGEGQVWWALADAERAADFGVVCMSQAEMRMSPVSAPAHKAEMHSR
jgi:hypothetical protein